MCHVTCVTPESRGVTMTCNIILTPNSKTKTKTKTKREMIIKIENKYKKKSPIIFDSDI